MLSHRFGHSTFLSIALKASWPEAHKLLELEVSKLVRFSAAISAWLMQVICPWYGGTTIDVRRA